MSKKSPDGGKKRQNTEELLLSNTKKRKLPLDVPNLIAEKDIELEENIIGTGTFSKVYRGIYKKQTIAVKIFKQRVSDEDFMKEVTTLRSLPHQNIVAFVGYCNIEQERKIIMEFMERGTLFDMLHKGLHEFVWLEKLQIIKQVTLAMKYLHSKHIAHCDLSSKNLLVGSSYEIKISDFGQCENMLNEPPTDMAPDTPNGKLRGTLRWMSKEILQKNNNHVLDKCDVWSFGVIMFEIGSSTIPYWDLTDVDVRAEIKKGQWPVAKDLNIWTATKIANAWKLLMDLCFFFSPHDRPSFEILDADVELLIKGFETKKPTPRKTRNKK